MTEEEYNQRKQRIRAKWQRKSHEIGVRYSHTSAPIAAAPAIARAMQKELAELEREREKATC